MENKSKRVNDVEYVVVPVTSGPDWHGRSGRRPQPKLKSEDPVYWFEVGRRFEAAGRPAEALRAYAKVLGLRSNHRGASLRVEQLRRGTDTSKRRRE